MIKRKMTSAFAVAAMMGVATAFAVNPFSDVPSDSWAYQAVDRSIGYSRYYQWIS